MRIKRKMKKVKKTLKKMSKLQNWLHKENCKKILKFQKKIFFKGQVVIALEKLSLQTEMIINIDIYWMKPIFLANRQVMSGVN